MTTRHDTLLPRPPGGNGPGALLALAVHAGLLVALTVSVDWRSQPADVVAAELWASVPQVAAPPPPPPAPEPQPEPRVTPRVASPPPAPRAEPQPREADIAIERAERRKAEAEKKRREELAEAEAERKKAEADRKKREDAAREAREAREAEAQEKRLAEQREANLRRIMGAAATAANGRSAGTAAQDAAPSAAYAGRVAALIRRASVFTGSVPGNPAAEVEVRASASGTILSWRIVKSSGYKAWDDAVLQAIEKTGTLPRDTDGRVPPQMIINFRPKDE